MTQWNKRADLTESPTIRIVGYKTTFPVISVKGITGKDELL